MAMDTDTVDRADTDTAVMADTADTVMTLMVMDTDTAATTITI